MGHTSYSLLVHRLSKPRADSPISYVFRCIWLCVRVFRVRIYYCLRVFLNHFIELTINSHTDLIHSPFFTKTTCLLSKILHILCFQLFLAKPLAPGYYSRHKRNRRQWLCKIWGVNKVHCGRFEIRLFWAGAPYGWHRNPSLSAHCWAYYIPKFLSDHSSVNLIMKGWLIWIKDKI